jgi:hypothetical protein
MPSSTPAVTEIELKLDEQVHQFLEIKQKLTYFLITASVAVIGFVFQFVADRLEIVGTLVWLVIVMAVAGLVTAGGAIWSLHLELLSYNRHLRARHQGRKWEELKQSEKDEWDRLISWAAGLLKASLGFLFIEIAMDSTLTRPKGWTTKRPCVSGLRWHIY